MAGRGRPKGSRNKSTLERQGNPGDNATLTPEQQEDRFDRHLEQYAEADAKAKSAAGAFRSLKARIKDEGGDIEELKIACMLETDEGAIQTKATLIKIARVSKYLGVPLGTQFDLFGAPAVSNGDEYERGYGLGKRAGLAGENRDPKFPVGAKGYDGYLAGYQDGQKINIGGISEKPADEPEVKAAKGSAKRNAKKPPSASASPPAGESGEEPGGSVVAFPGGGLASSGGAAGSYQDVS